MSASIPSVQVNPDNMLESVQPAAPAVAHAASPPSSTPSTPSANSNPAQNPSPKHHHSSNHHSSYNKNSKWKNNHHSPPPPTNCVVLKNLDYNITRSILEDVVRRVTAGHNDFVSVNLIDDKYTGTFRGMAFVNFHTTRDATAALSELSKMVINDRKVIAEYRRLRPGEKKEYEKRGGKKYDNYYHNHRQTFEKHVELEPDANGVAIDKRVAFFATRDHAKKDAQKQFEMKTERDKHRDAQFRALLVQYANGELENGSAKDIVFDSSLTSYERKMVHHICDEMNLGHISRFDEQGNRVLNVTRDPERAAAWEKEAMEAKEEARKQAAEQKRKAKEDINFDRNKSEPTTPSPNAEELQGIQWFKPRAALNSDGDDKNTALGIRAPTFKTYIPQRKPKGPDGTIGFTVRVKAFEKKQAELTSATGGDVGNGIEENGQLSADDASSAASDASSGKSVASTPTKSGKSSQRGLDPNVPPFSPSSVPSS
ncbi:RNA-binding post-transcriptional regulator cip2 [Gracilariopsis chorda]|uniref:RNA-binding post-transcriptional regulator cip2 n=1 Tax=Gracilariopsis chorda TaxID=448386 RepID=A0A2V3IHV7_9FLOR|nr:RNA-binding post-transcriptional regulator cip2 [Gracilariopsis chorda]|eukprot:PXF41652.1 RNA-binding post-transcriptional regulator cip2 [Gracilariopsis chorda]